MSTIRPTSQALLVEAIDRLRLKSAGGKEAGAGKLGAPESIGLRQRLAALATEIGGRDDDVLRSQVVRCILLDQWGEHAADDPLFVETSEAVERDLRSRPEFDSIFREAIKALVNSPAEKIPGI